MTPEQAQAAVARYRERYLPVGIYECTLYPGIPELLEQLRVHGFRVAVATGKPTPMARSILQRFDLERLFDCVIGCEYDGTRSTKAEVVTAVLAETHGRGGAHGMTSPVPLPAVCRASACTTAMQSRVSWRPPARRQWCRPSQSWASGCCTGTRHDTKTPCGI
ncbi:MAG: HAD family hydrolase [Oscillospiraceae bacterium]